MALQGGAFWTGEGQSDLGVGAGRVLEGQGGRVEGLGGGSKKWQFQFPGTYNTDATLELRKGGEERR